MRSTKVNRRVTGGIITMKEIKFRCIYDGDSFIDGIEFDTFEKAKETALEILGNWMEACLADTPQEWNDMVNNCMTWVEEYDEEADEWNDIWHPSDEDLVSIGWVEIHAE